MGYDEFWFIETRNQSKNLKRWFIWGIFLFVFVGVGTYFGVRSMYNTMNDYEIHSENPVIVVDEAKQTNENGYIKGTIKNNSEELLKGKYIKCTFYTKNGTELGNEYIEIGDLQPSESKTYELKFRYSNVKKFIMTISDNKE